GVLLPARAAGHRPPLPGRGAAAAALTLVAPDRRPGGPRPGGAPVNIAVFGWYHHRNAGDDRIQQCLTRWLDGHTLAFLPAGRRPPVHLLRTYDAAIL